MELFDIIELQSYVTPLAERLEQAAEDQRNAESVDPSNVTGGNQTTGTHPDWTPADNANPPPDILLSSNDSTVFHVHQSRLRAISTNGFNRKLPLLEQEINGVSSGSIRQHVINGIYDRPPPATAINVPYSSTVVNLLLQTVYSRNESRSGQNQVPSLPDIASTLYALKEYGIPLEIATSETSSLFDMLAFHCQDSSALEVYILAASYPPELHHVAVYASRFLLSIQFHQLSDNTCSMMGAIYLRELYAMLTGRTREFKRLLLANPTVHGPYEQCNTDALRDAWRASSAFLLWCAAPDVKETTIDNTKASVIDRVQCTACKNSLNQRFEDLKRSWALVKDTI